MAWNEAHRVGSYMPILGNLYVGYSLDELKEGHGCLLTRMSSLRSCFIHGGQ